MSLVLNVITVLIRFYDVRTKVVAYEWKTTSGTGGRQ